MKMIFERCDAIDLTENHIKQLHRDLLKYSNKDQRHRGEYKTLANHVEALGPDGKSLGVVFETATPFDTPRLMRERVPWIRKSLRDKDIHPLLCIAAFIVTFLAIHPFQDGNGRLSRILTTLLLLRAGYAYVPYSSLESVIEQSKDSYYLALRRTQGKIRTKKPDWQPWVTYFLTALKQQKDRLEKKIERERILLGDLPELSVQILELCRERGRVTVNEISKVTGISRNTVKDHVTALTEKRHLSGMVRDAERGIRSESVASVGSSKNVRTHQRKRRSRSPVSRRCRNGHPRSPDFETSSNALPTAPQCTLRRRPFSARG
jgi:Fic family protein